MKVNSEKEIYKKCIAINITPQHVVEVGVHLPDVSNIVDFIKQGIRTTLVEPDPRSIKAINKYFKGYDNITLHPVAAFDSNGTVSLYRRAASTFMAEPGSSPAMINDNYKLSDTDKFDVEAKMFSEIDDGSIDLLSIDIEGAEWYVVKHLVSRPKVISVETHGKYYINPKLEEISDWMKKNGYIIWYKDGSDTVYIKAPLYQPTFFDSLKLNLYNAYLALRRAKKIFKYGLMYIPHSILIPSELFTETIALF